MSRNDVCHCGSGKRYKHCHGQRDAVPLAAKPARGRVRYDALAAHRAGRLGSAESLYLQALEENPADVDSLHMLGAVQYERSRYQEALENMARAADLAGWAVPRLRRNAELVISKLLANDANMRQTQLLHLQQSHLRNLEQTRTDVSPLVSIVVTAVHPVPVVVRTVRAMLLQTYSPMEIVVAWRPEDAPAMEQGAAALAGLDGTVRHVASAASSLAALRNQGAAHAKGSCIAFVASDTWYSADGVAGMVNSIVRRGARWGFGSVLRGGDGTQGAQEARGRARVDTVSAASTTLVSNWPLSFQMLEQGFDVADGNVFIERKLFEQLEGYRDLPEGSAKDFCLRASALAEPVLAPVPLYRGTAGQGVTMAAEAAGKPLPDVAMQLVSNVLYGQVAAENALAPQFVQNRSLLLRTLLREGVHSLVSPETFQRIVGEFRHTSAAARGPRAMPLPAPTEGKTALVVLGMHRSGTSALARLLNLCGAFLPSNLMPPKVGVNPKGFWEPEAVVDLNNRFMGRLGGSWSTADLAVPESGEVIDDFVADVQAVIAREYGDHPLILVKDPRICMLAPLWDRALRTAGYRPTYVVPVRDPVEVAQSLHARDGLAMADGLMLWHAYTQRAEAFAATCGDVAYVRFTDLLVDWRGGIAHIRARLGVALESTGQEATIAQFLDADLRNQKGQHTSLETLLDPGRAAQVRSLYHALLARSDADAAQLPAADVLAAARPSGA